MKPQPYTGCGIRLTKFRYQPYFLSRLGDARKTVLIAGRQHAIILIYKYGHYFHWILYWIMPAGRKQLVLLVSVWPRHRGKQGTTVILTGFWRWCPRSTRWDWKSVVH